jgi:septin family protein
MQLVRNCEFVGRLLGAEATNHVTPFDWLICDTAATARMIESDEYFPNNQTEIELEPKPRWKRMGCYYWHEPTLPSGFESVRSKFAHTKEMLRQATERARRVFIVSNTQNNLDTVDTTVNGFDFTLNDHAIDRLRSALSAKFGNVELYAVSRPERNSITDPRNKSILFNIKPDSTVVRGDSAEWQSVLARILKA